MTDTKNSINITLQFARKLKHTSTPTLKQSPTEQKFWWGYAAGPPET